MFDSDHATLVCNFHFQFARVLPSLLCQQMFARGFAVNLDCSKSNSDHSDIKSQRQNNKRQVEITVLPGLRYTMTLRGWHRTIANALELALWQMHRPGFPQRDYIMCSTHCQVLCIASPRYFGVVRHCLSHHLEFPVWQLVHVSSIPNEASMISKTQKIARACVV